MLEQQFDDDYYKLLLTEVKKHNYAYFVKHKPLISDLEYDQIYHLLVEVEKIRLKNGLVNDSESPTQQIGYSVKTTIDGFRKEKHNRKMYSLNNMFSISDVDSFVIGIRQKMQSYLIDNRLDFIFQPKIDGLSLELYYDDGRLVRGITRGDGIVGDDVTSNVLTISNIPKTIEIKEPISIFGECYMRKDVFLELNQKNDGCTYANARNAAAGSLRLLDPKECSNRKLQFVAYDLYSFDEDLVLTQVDLIKMLSNWNFEVPETIIETDIDKFEKIIHDFEFNKRYDYYHYDIDGIAMKLNDIELSKQLGYTAKAPRWANAYKFKAEHQRTKIVSVEMTVGRTGIITPVANVVPVVLSGSIVSRCTLHNFSFVKNLDIRVGDIVDICKSGEIIPEITSVYYDARTGIEKEIVPPCSCPVCGCDVYKDDDVVAYICANPNCPAVLKRTIENFVSKNNMNILGLGEKIIDALVDTHMVTNVADLYDLTEDQLNKLVYNSTDKSDGRMLGKTIAKKIISAIENSKQQPFFKVLSALSINLVGPIVAQLLTSVYSNIDDIINASIDELSSIDGIGPKIANEISRFFDDLDNLYIIGRLKKNGLNLSEQHIGEEFDNKLQNTTFVITGGLSIPRSEMETIIKKHGGRVTGSVSKKTSYLICGIDYGNTKYNKAEKFGIPIITEDRFWDLIRM